jgi:hypothetical protein
MSWEQHEQIQRMMADNSYGGERTGAAKNGSALLAGLLRCRRCGRKLMVRYTGSHHDVLRYVCRRGWLDNGEPPCISFRRTAGRRSGGPADPCRGATRSRGSGGVSQ